MKQDGGIGKKGILAIGQIKGEKMLVITKDYNIYTLPMASLENSFNKLYINGTKPEPMQTKWPKCWNSPDFIRTKEILYNAFFYVEDSGDYFFMTVKGVDHPGNDGAVYDIEHQNAYDGLRFGGSDDQVNQSKKYSYPSLL